MPLYRFSTLIFHFWHITLIVCGMLKAISTTFS